MTLAELTTPLTADQAKALIYQQLADRGITTTSWKPGAVVRTLIAVFSTMLASLSELAAHLASSGFLALSAGEWLTLVARYVYGVERFTGAFASGDLSFDNAGGGVYTGGPGDLIGRNSGTGKTYRNTAAFTIGSGATGVIIPFQAVELGTASTSTPGTIDTLVTPLAGVTVTNPAALIGADAESDEALRLRCVEKLGSLSPNGPRDAYAYIARSTILDGANVGVTRVKTTADGIGGVDVYLADATGTLSGTVGDPTTKLGAVDEGIQTQCAPLAITARTHAASAKSIAVTYELWIRRRSMSDSDVQGAVTTQLTSWMSSQPIGGHDIGAGGKVYVSAIESVIGATEVLDVIRVVVTVPAADVTIAATEAPVVGVITCTAIHQIDEAGI
jgi:phage-related baseplate assembly protein